MEILLQIGRNMTIVVHLARWCFKRIGLSQFRLQQLIEKHFCTLCKNFVRLSYQNQGLVTSEWCMLHRQEKTDGQLLVLGVDDASLMVLRNMDVKAHLELSRVTFELPSKKQESTER